MDLIDIELLPNKFIESTSHQNSVSVIDLPPNEFIESTSLQNSVSMILSKQVISTLSKNSSNVIFSPASINVVLSIIAAGSTGATKEQILSFFKFSSTEQLNTFFSEVFSTVLADGSASGGPCLLVANGVWIDKELSFKPSFNQLLEDSYKAVSYQADFKTNAVEVIAEVNSWAEKHTNGLITEILPQGSANSMTKLIFANALYFKGTWTHQFDAYLTEDGDFHRLDGTKVTTPFMTSKKKQFVSAYDGFKVLELPYLEGQDKRKFSMYLYLPDKNNGLPDLLDKMASTPKFFENHIPREQVKLGKFKIPKFKFSFGFEASEVLKGLGLTSPFLGEDGMTEMVESPEMGKSLCVSNIFHKACIEVNEEGTEAAATSVIEWEFTRLCMERETMDFVADHPFLLVITENITGVVLFIGQVLDPSA